MITFLLLHLFTFNFVLRLKYWLVWQESGTILVVVQSSFEDYSISIYSNIFFFFGNLNCKISHLAKLNLNVDSIIIQNLISNTSYFTLTNLPTTKITEQELRKIQCCIQRLSMLGLT
uniref:Uncharacterized protein n=1 Tax=Cacopsylla melanoneura TaxID=428564 RepID=A0A8D8RW71_9HEMI